jgi:hypothetical protein
VLVRGRRLDGPQRLWFHSADDQYRTKNLEIVSRRRVHGLPTSTLVRRPGCYAWQIDGQGFSRIIVFKAVRQQMA